MTDIKRRTLLKGTLATGLACAAASAGLLMPRAVLAAWPKNAFEAATVDNAVKDLLGTTELTASDKIQIKLPPIAENGAVVNVAVETTLTNVDSMTILAEKNNNPLCASFNMGPSMVPYIKTRIKVAKTSSIIAVIRSGGKLYSAGQEVKVTIGGCGG